MNKKTVENATELIGGTPLLRLNRIAKAEKLKGSVLAKLESFNPARSVKDRVALSLIQEAEKRGLVDKNTVIIEPTSGNRELVSQWFVL